MAFTEGLRTINTLAADQPVTNSVVLVNVTGFTFTLPAGKRLKWELRGIFSTGATGGFRLRANSTTAPGLYNAEWFVQDVTTPAPFAAAQLAAADFTNASAVATAYTLRGWGLIVAGAASTVFSIQVAQNNATANALTLSAGTTLELCQF